MTESLSGTRTLDFRTLLRRSFENLWLIRMQVLGYLGIFTILALVLPLINVRGGGGAIAVYLIGQHWLYRSLLKARGLLENSRNHLIAFFGLALVLFLPIFFGLVALLLPGLFLVARWIAAPAFVVGRGEGPLEAARSSWRAVRGHTVKVAGVVVIMFLIVSALGALTGAIDGQIGDLDAYRQTKPVDLIELHFLPVLLLGLSTAIYELLGPQDTMIEEVFG